MTTSTPTWIAGLTDSGIRSEMTSLTGSGSFSYGSALSLLDYVAGRGSVTAAEFADLQTIAANLENGITTSDQVASLFYQLVDGSPANATYTGGATSSATLGNLAAGAGAAQLNELISKWFLGADLPNPVSTGSGSTPTITPSYQAYTTALFGSGGVPTVADVNQGDVGDCELCSGMIEVTVNSPSTIQSMIVSDGNGVYGVRFYVNGKETWVTVNDQLPTYKGQLLYNEGTGLWADLVEKAYAELSATGHIGLAAVNSYDNINADPPFYVLSALTDCSNVQYLYSSQSDWNGFKNAVINAVAAHNDVILESNGNTYDSSGNQMLVNDHAFAVVGYDGATGDFIVRNPWGTLGGSGYDVQFEVSMADIAKVNGDFVLDNAANPNVVTGSLAGLTGLAANTDLTSLNPAAQFVTAGKATPISPLLTSIDTKGGSVSQYMFSVAGGGTVQLNGAANLASAAQTSAGEIVVAAADLAKLTFTASGGASYADLLVSQYDGNSWNTASDIQLSVTTSPVVLLPSLNTVVAQGSATKIASLFTTLGSYSGGATTYYQITTAGGLGSINLNGAQNLLSASSGWVEVSAAQLSSLTYTAPNSAGMAVLEVRLINGGSTSDINQIPVIVGDSVANTLQTFNTGAIAYQTAVVDSAANVFANLDALQQMMPPWDLLGITLTDTGTPRETVTATQLANDSGVLSIISGNYSLTVSGLTVAQAVSTMAAGGSHLAAVAVTDTGADIVAGLASLQTLAAANQLASVTDSDATATIASLTAAQFSADMSAVELLPAGVEVKVSGSSAASAIAAGAHLASASVSDSAADVSANLDSLESLATSGRLTAISLSDAGVPTLSVTAAQLAGDSAALADISGSFNLSIAAGGASRSIAGLSGHANTVAFAGAASQYTVTAGGNGTSFTVSGNGASDQISNVNALQFSDFTDIVASQTPPVAGAVSSAQVTELYGAVFGRTPDVGGLEFYQAYAAANPSTPFLQYAEWFLSSTEYASNSAHDYAQTVAGDQQFITDSYSNLLRRTPSAAETAFYENFIAGQLSGLTSGTAAYAAAQTQAHAQVLVYFSQSPEFLSDVSVTATTPSSASHWLILI